MKNAFRAPGLLAMLLAPGNAAFAGAFPYDVHTRALDNGLQIAIIPMPSPGVVAYATWMAVGSGDEVTAGRTGFAHFFEHLMFYGTDDLPREAREAELLRMGAQENAWTWLDETVYHLVVQEGALPRVIDIEADRFLGLQLTDDMVRREAGAVRGEFLKGRASPDNVLAEHMAAAIWPHHPYGHDTIGTEADVEAMPDAVEHARAFFHTYYAPSRATILVAGDVDPDAVFPLLEAAYGGWAPLPEAEQPAPIPAEPDQDGMREVHVDWPASTAPRLTLAWRVPAHDPDDPAVAALDLAEGLLLSDIGPLKRRLVDEEQLAYEVWGGRDAFVRGATFSVSMMLRDAESAARAEEIIREEIAALAGGVDPGRLDATRAHDRYALLLGLDDPANTVQVFGWAARRGGMDALDRFLDAKDAVTADQLAEVVGGYLVDAHLTRGTLTGPGGDE